MISRLFASCFGIGAAFPRTGAATECQDQESKPKLLLCGEDSSGKTDIFLHYARQVAAASSQCAADPHLRTKNKRASPLTNEQTLIVSLEGDDDDDNTDKKDTRVSTQVGFWEMPRRTPSRSSTSSTVASAANTDQGPWRMSSSSLFPIPETTGLFEITRATLVDIPAPARYDYEFLNSQNGSICYVVSLAGAFVMNQSKSVLETELENIAAIFRSLRLPPLQFVMIIFNHVDVFEKTMREGIQVLPEFLSSAVVACEGATAPEVTRLVVEHLKNKVLQDAHKTTNAYVFSTTSMDCTHNKLTKMVTTLHIAGELAKAGFLN